jgi:hypothetical protein
VALKKELDSPLAAQAPESGTAPSAAGRAGPEVKWSCPECALLKTQLEELRGSRDEALLALGKEREFLEGMRLKYSMEEHRHRTAEEPPLRHVLVDRVNDAIKSRLGFVHRGARTATAFLLRLTEIWK